MQVEKKDLENSAVKLIIKIEPSEFKPYEEQAFKNLSQNLKIKGFRAGKVPAKILKEKISDDQVFSEALDKALPEFFYKAILSEKIMTVGSPKIDIGKYEKGKPLVINAEVDVLPDFKLPDYKNIKIQIKESTTSDKEIQETLKELQNAYGETRPKLEPSAIGDRMEIDFEGYIENIKIDSLTSKNHPIVLGKSGFIPGFEDNLLGLNQGDEKEFELELPDKVGDKMIAGKKAKFKVKVLSLQRVILPEIDDVLAKKISKFKTLKELKEDIRKSLIKRKEVEGLRKAENEIMEKIAKQVNIKLPQGLIAEETNRMAQQIAADVSQRGLPFPEYLKSIKKTEKEFFEGLKPQAEKTVKMSLILGKIKADMKIKVTDSEISEEIENMKKLGQQITDDENTKRYFGHVLGNRKTLEKLRELCLGKSISKTKSEK